MVFVAIVHSFQWMNRVFQVPATPGIGSAFLSMNSSSLMPSIVVGRLTRLCFPSTNMVMNSCGRRLFSARSAAVSFRLGFFMFIKTCCTLLGNRGPGPESWKVPSTWSYLLGIARVADLRCLTPGDQHYVRGSLRPRLLSRRYHRIRESPGIFGKLRSSRVARPRPRAIAVAAMSKS